MLTRPNVIVPVHSARGPVRRSPSSSSSSSSATASSFRAARCTATRGRTRRAPRSPRATLGLLLRGPAARPALLQAGAQRILERTDARARACGQLRRLDLASLGLRLDELAHALAVLVVKSRDVERLLERGDELLGEAELLLRRCAPGGPRQVARGDDLVGEAHRHESEPAFTSTQDAHVVLLAHHPAR